MIETAIKEAFGETLRKRRLEINSTQKRIAEACDRSTRYYQFYENGDYDPSMSTIFLLAEALKTTPDKLIETAWTVWKRERKNR